MDRTVCVHQYIQEWIKGTGRQELNIYYESTAYFKGTQPRSFQGKARSIKKGIARTQSPTNKNYAFELPTFGVIVGVNPTKVQWPGLTLEEPPS
jgi:hypothetical protein